MTDCTDFDDDTVSRLLGVLSDERRRVIIRHLVRSPSGTGTVEELVERIAERTDGDEPVEDRIEIRLYHVDLPALADAGVVEYDWRSGDASLTVDSDAMTALLERLKAAEWRSGEQFDSPLR